MVDFIIILQFVETAVAIELRLRDALVSQMRFLRAAIGVEFPGHILIVSACRNEVGVSFGPGIFPVAIGLHPGETAIEGIGIINQPGIALDGKFAGVIAAGAGFYGNIWQERSLTGD